MRSETRSGAAAWGGRGARGGHGNRAHAAATLLLALMALPSAAPAHAQVSAGDSVRLRVTGALRVEAMTTGLRGDTLLLSLAGLTSIWPVPMSDIVRLEAFVERSPREGLRHGVAIGAGAGLFAGAIVGVGLYTGFGGGGADDASEMMSTVLSWSGVGVVAGAVVGAVLGGARPGRGWVVVPLPGR